MKIVIIGPNVGMGGVERASSNIANGLVDLGHSVTYLALIPEKHFFDLKADYVEPISFNQAHMNFPKTLKYIRKEVVKINPDAILCFTKFYAALANLSLLFTKHKIFVTERSSPFYKWPYKVEILCKLSFTIKRPIGVISQTAIASKHHKKHYGNTQYIVIPNAVREIKKHPAINREPIILAVGRFNDNCKGFDLLVKAFNLLENKDWKLVFAGGTEKEGGYLLDLVEDEKKNRIEFLGAVKDMDLIYAKAGVFVMPSRSEGFPNALAEALCAGCCCVSFDFIAGPRDLIKNEVNGIIVEAENFKALANKLDSLIKNEEQRKLLTQNSEILNNTLKLKSIVNKYINFIEYAKK